MKSCVSLLLLFCVLGFNPPAASGRIDPAKWGLSFGAADSLAIAQAGYHTRDSLLHFLPAQRIIYVKMEPPHPFENAAPDFYLLCFLCLLLGLIRYREPRYFSLLLGAFRNAGSGRQWQDMLRASALPNLGMNLFFAVVAGAYIFYISGGRESRLLGGRGPLLLPLLIGSMMLVYAGKYLILRFSGWAFRVKPIADEYLFHVFLVNKILGIVLLPFVVLIAFTGNEWREPLGIVSGVVAVALICLRYLRSWPAFQALVKGSRFHFLTYLCASEILPMAVLVKWLLQLLR